MTSRAAINPIVAAWLMAGLSLALLGCGVPAPDTTNQSARPNVLLIVADDLGYSDIGVFGGEIATPNLDQLASNGVQLTHFHVATNCSPTRAMLMTGMDNHRVGLGTMAEVIQLRFPELADFPGYEGYLSFRAPTLAELMKDAGYRTYMTGKWHLGLEKETSPYARGFQRTFAMLEGASGHLNDWQVVPGIERDRVLFREDGELTSIPEDFYSSRTFAEKLIGFLEAESDSPQPFFAYLAFTAPHWPIQAPRGSIDRHKGDYDEGYDTLFDARLARQKALGLVEENVHGQPLPPGLKPWQTLTSQERRFSARKMEVYAAMVADMDFYIGRVLRALEAQGTLDNTLVIFMSDNGAEGNTADRAPAWRRFVDAKFDNRYENLGDADSYFFYGPEWARVSSVPSKFYKSNTTQGGILSPAIVSFASGEQVAERYDGFLSVMDVMPTILEVAGIEHEVDDELPLMGRSFASLLTADPAQIHPDDYEMGWEMVNHRAYRMGHWKLVMTQAPWGNGEWALYDIEADPSESRDLKETRPKLFADLIARWYAYAEANQVAVFVDGQVPNREYH